MSNLSDDITRQKLIHWKTPPSVATFTGKHWL